MAGDDGEVLARAVASLLRPATAVLARRRFDGLEHLPAHGPAIVAGNHVSHVDPLYTAVFVHRRGRAPRFLAKAGLWRVPVLGALLRAAGQIPVQRGSLDAAESLCAAERSIAGGGVVVVYPEGTLTRDPDRWPMRARTGVARLALACDAPVVPLVHWGTHRLYDHDGRRARPGPWTRVVLRAGPPVDLRPYRGRPVDGPLLREVTDAVTRRLTALLADVRGEAAPAVPHDPGPR